MKKIKGYNDILNKLSVIEKNNKLIKNFLESLEDWLYDDKRSKDDIKILFETFKEQVVLNNDF